MYPVDMDLYSQQGYMKPYGPYGRWEERDLIVGGGNDYGRGIPLSSTPLNPDSKPFMSEHVTVHER